jgi:hypothetical protein
MRADDLHESLRAQPFRHFRILLTDGSVYEVRHPEAILVTRSTIHLYQQVETEPGVSHEVLVKLSLLHVIRTEELPPS